MPVGVDAGEVLQADSHLAYVDAKVFYQGFLRVVRGRLRVLIAIAKLRDTKQLPDVCGMLKEAGKTCAPPPPFLPLQPHKIID